MAYLVAVAISILRANGPTWLDRNLFCFILADCPIVCNELRIKNSDFWFYLVGRFLDPPVYPGWQQSEKEIKNFYFQIKRFDIGWVPYRLTDYSDSILCGWNFLPFSPKPVFFRRTFWPFAFCPPILAEIWPNFEAIDLRLLNELWAGILTVESSMLSVFTITVSLLS